MAEPPRVIPAETREEQWYQHAGRCHEGFIGPKIEGWLGTLQWDGEAKNQNGKKAEVTS